MHSALGILEQTVTFEAIRYHSHFQPKLIGQKIRISTDPRSDKQYSYKIKECRRIMSSGDSVVLSANQLSSISMALIMGSALSISTLVNSAVMS